MVPPVPVSLRPRKPVLNYFYRAVWLREPYGISSISVYYNRRMMEAFTGLPNFHRVMDDIVIYNNNIANHVTHVIAKFCSIVQTEI